MPRGRSRSRRVMRFASCEALRVGPKTSGDASGFWRSFGFQNETMCFRTFELIHWEASWALASVPCTWSQLGSSSQVHGVPVFHRSAPGPGAAASAESAPIWPASSRRAEVQASRHSHHKDPPGGVDDRASYLRPDRPGMVTVWSGRSGR